MTIELRVPFLEKEDALELQKFLKKNGCQSRLETRLKHDKSMRYSATIGAIKRFLANLETRDKDKPEWEYEKEMVNSVHSWVDAYFESISEFYQKFEIGGTYSLGDICPTIAENTFPDTSKTTDELDDDEKNRLLNMMKESRMVFGSIACLRENDVLTYNADNDTYTFTQKKPVDDVVVEYTGNMFGHFAIDDLENAGFSLWMKSTVLTTYTVIAGPEYITIGYDALEKFLLDFDMYAEDVDDVLIPIKLNAVLIRQILDIIADKGPIDPSDLIDILLEYENVGKINFEIIDDESMQAILNDLKKIEFITIKNGFVKLSR